jgi:hypothetical protein
MKQTIQLVCLVSLMVLCALPAIAENRYGAGGVPVGVSRLPIGIFAVHEDFLHLARIKDFEVVHNYRFEEVRDKDDELGDYLNAAGALGLKVMVGFDRKEGFTVARAEERVRRFKQHPAVWAWYLYDEPRPEMLERAKEVVASIRRNDAKHPIIIASKTPEDVALVDMSIAYSYPVKDQPSPTNDLNDYLVKTEAAVVWGKPFISLIQTFNWNHYWPFSKRRERNRLPTLPEMRFMAYTGILKGCRGVFFFSFQTLPIEHDHLNGEVVPLIKELKEIREFLMWRQTEPEAFVNGFPRGAAGAWTDGGKTLLILSNPSPSLITASLKTDGRIFTEFRDRRRNIGQVEQLHPWDIRIYLIEDKKK